MTKNELLFKKVKKLNLPLGSYALFGSAPLGIRNLKECNDIDIIVTPELWETCLNKGWTLKESENKPACLILNDNNDIELWKEWGPGPWDILRLISEAEILDDLPFVKLENLLKWKKLNAREKDLKDVEIIENFLL